ncbi:MAG: DNA replication/repair protein RecF [Desulfuromonadales bacterium]|nr:DNA replication/repair protein RecF [Desulfuromonadales bacterium]
MVINNLYLKNFRNIDQEKLNFNSRFNIFSGYNGHGKTNYIEAIFFIGTLKSFRNPKQADLIRWDQPFAFLECSSQSGCLKNDLQVLIEPSTKVVKIDNKHPNRILDYCKAISVIAFAPDELAMVTGTPEQRRRYLDRAIFSCQPDYLKAYREYFKALKQRNYLLKQKNYRSIEAWTEELIKKGAQIIFIRNAYIKALSSKFSILYQDISSSDEKVKLCYHSKPLAFLDNIIDIENNLRKSLSEISNKEKECCTTLVGPHRDDIGFFLNEKLIKQHGSQGQQKSFVLALKMSEIEYIYDLYQEYPLLLLDDMTAELDKIRVNHMLRFLLDREMQVFITTTDAGSIVLPDESIKTVFFIENGRSVNEGLHG